MMSLWDALRMNMMISYQELVRTFLRRSHESWHGESRYQSQSFLAPECCETQSAKLDKCH
ncbi:hypothetical protein AWP71_17985 [Escherichia coli]|nr:hypothetical protein AWP71_17985 [Escherichia coli]